MKTIKLNLEDIERALTGDITIVPSSYHQPGEKILVVSYQDYEKLMAVHSKHCQESEAILDQESKKH
jgi:hypothetical protein